MSSIAQGSALGFQQEETDALKHQALPVMGATRLASGKEAVII